MEQNKKVCEKCEGKGTFPIQGHHGRHDMKCDRCGGTGAKLNPPAMPNDHRLPGHVHRATYGGDGCKECDELFLRGDHRPRPAIGCEHKNTHPVLDQRVIATWCKDCGALQPAASGVWSAPRSAEVPGTSGRIAELEARLAERTDAVRILTEKLKERSTTSATVTIAEHLLCSSCRSVASGLCASDATAKNIAKWWELPQPQSGCTHVSGWACANCDRRPDYAPPCEHPEASIFRPADGRFGWCRACGSLNTGPGWMTVPAPKRSDGQ